MTRSLMLAIAFSALALGCKKTEKAAKPAETPPAANNAMTQHAADLQNSVDKAKAAQQTADALIKKTSQGAEAAGNDAEAPQ